MKNKNLVPTLSLICAQIMWGINTPVIKLGLQHVRLPIYHSVTMLGASVLLLPSAIKHWKPLKFKYYALLIIGSIVSISIGNIALLMGLERVPSINAPLIGLFGPLILFILSSQFLKEKLNLKVFIGIIVALLGGLLCVSGPVSGGSFGLNSLMGNMLIILSMLSGVLGTLICKPVLKHAGSQQVAFVHLFSGILPVIIFSTKYVGELAPSNLSSTGVLCMAFNIFAVSIANLLFMYGLKNKTAQETALFSYIHPFVTALSAWVILSEQPAANIYAGGFLIILGVYISEIDSYKRKNNKNPKPA